MGAGASTENEEIIVPETSMPKMQSQFSGRSGSQVSSDAVRITKDGFYPSEKSISEGEDVVFEWDETASGATTLIQVVNDGKELKPVVDGYGGNRGSNGTFRQRFYLEGQYKFAVNPIRFTPFTVTVKKQTEILVDVTDYGFSNSFLDINQGQSIHWVWRSCAIPHTIREYSYLLDRRSFQPKDQKTVATVSGSHLQKFDKPGVYYFKTESSEPGQFPLCIVRVRNGSREHKIEVLDQTFEPTLLVIQEGDRVWWEWTKEKCKKLHNVYQIDAPSLDHEEEAYYEATPEGFQWPHKPSKQGLMTHKFTKPGVYHYSDRNYDEAAVYIGTIIVKPKAKEHVVRVTENGFEPDIIRVNTDELLWLVWNKATYANTSKLIQLVEEEKIQSPINQTSEIDVREVDPVRTEDLRVMTKAGIAFLCFTSVGVYTYKMTDRNNKAISTISVIVNPGPKNHTIHVTDTGYEPSIITVRPNDRVWWLWVNMKRPHNIMQFSHYKDQISTGFCSGLPRDSDSAFYHQFLHKGVFYYGSLSLPEKFGSIIVTSQPHVHEIEISKKEVETTTVQVNDIVCWTFSAPVNENVIALQNLNEALKPQTENTELSLKRRCVAKLITDLGITPFFSKSFVKYTYNVNVVVCDERMDYHVIKVNKRGFHPKEIYLQKGMSLMWTWKGTDEEHNIIHVTDPDSNQPLDKIYGKKAFNSGKPLRNSNFLFPFDEPGDYAVISQGAPAFSCVVHVRESIPQSSTPTIVPESEKKLEDGNVQISLKTKTQNAEIYYTTDGNLPALHLDGIKHYIPERGVVMRESSVLRAITVAKEEVQSYPFTSLPFYIEPKEEKEVYPEETKNEAIVKLQEPLKEGSFIWWECRPHIRGCITGPGTFQVFWDLPKSSAARRLIKGYNIFANGVSYCVMFPISNHSVTLTGLAGGRKYQVNVKAYSVDPENRPQCSNNLYVKCPILTEENGPVISLVKTKHEDSLAIVWMSIDKPEFPIDGYLVYLNDNQCGPKLVPDPKSNRCKVVIDGCDLNMEYKVHVQAISKDSSKTLISNLLVITLPLNTENFIYPEDQTDADEEDLYNEFIEVTEGSGQLPAKENEDSQVWETETDTTSGLDEHDQQKEDKTLIDDDQDVVVDQIESDLPTLAQRKSCFQSFATPEMYYLEKQASFQQQPYSFYTLCKVIARLCFVYKRIKYARSKMMARSALKNGKMKVPKYFVTPPSNGEGSGMMNSRSSHLTPQTGGMRTSGRMHDRMKPMPELSQEYFKTPGGQRYFDEASFSGTFDDGDSNQDRNYLYGNDYIGRSLDKGSPQLSDYSQMDNRREKQHHSHRSGQRQDIKQVRFANASANYGKQNMISVNSDSSFSCDDDSVEQLYQSQPRQPAHQNTSKQQYHPRPHPVAQQNSFEHPSIVARKHQLAHQSSSEFAQMYSQRRQEEYFLEFDSDHSNYDYSREESSGTGYKAKHKSGRIVRNVQNFEQHEDIFYGEQLEIHDSSLPQESSGMLARYLEYFEIEVEKDEKHASASSFPNIPAVHPQLLASKTNQFLPFKASQMPATKSDHFEKEPEPESEDEGSVKHIDQHDNSTVFLDATSNKEDLQPVNKETATLLRAQIIKPGMGLAIIEVQKTQISTTDDTQMIRVQEGELVAGDNNSLLPSPLIMARSVDRQSMEVGWRLNREIQPPHELQLYVVNVIGTKFASNINSDISYECNLVENGKQIRGVQHCWNIEKKNECLVEGLLSGQTYRTYVVGNYSVTSDGVTSESQTTSPILYYTIVGPPSPPNLQTVKVDSYQACIEWLEPTNEKGLPVKGYQIYVDGKPLGGRRGVDVRKMTINNLVPGKTMSVYISALSEFGQDESEPSKTVHITCPPRPVAPVIAQQPSYKKGSVLIGWSKPESPGVNSREESISFYIIYLDGKWHGEVKSNQLNDKQGYHFYLTDLSPEQSYDVSIKAVAGERLIDPKAQHVFCLSESAMSNIIPVMAPAAPKSPKLRLEGLHPDGIDVTWQVPQQLGDAYISGYQMLKNGKLYGSIIPPDVNSLSIRDVTLGERIELQLIALTEHPVGKSEGSKDSGTGTSLQDEKMPEIFTGELYAGCKPGPKLVVHYTGLVSAPTEVWCEKTTGHSLLIVWTKNTETKAHFLRPDSYQVTWWPGDRPKDEIQSDSTTDDHLLISGLRPSTSYTVVVEARKTEKYTDFDEAFGETDKSEGLNSFILSSKSEQMHVRTASPPDPPSNVGIVAMTCHSIKLGWDPPREHGSEIIGIRVECLSQDASNPHIVSVNTLPDATSADAAGLSEKTDYLLKVIAVTEEYFDQLPEKNQLKQLKNFPPNISVTQEESIWLPFTCILFKTSGTEAPCNIRVIKSTMTSLTLTWTPPLVYGSNKLTGQILRWSALKSAQNKDDDVHIASHVKLLPTEDTLTIDDLSPGTQYNIVAEAVVSVKTSLEPEKWDGNNIEKNRRTAHVMSKGVVVRTRAPIDPPQLIVTSYNQTSATLTWQKPLLVSALGKDSNGNCKCLRRYLQGYKLEINGKLQTCLGPESTSCTLTKCKPGKNYSVVLVAVTCTSQGRKFMKQKFENIQKDPNSDSIDYLSFLQENEHLDESPSDPIHLLLPRDQDGFLESLEAKFVPLLEKDINIFGEIELTWKLQGSVKLVKQFSVVWYSMDDRVIQTKYLSPEQRRCTIPVTMIKTLYTMKVEPSYYSDVLSQHSQEVQLMIPGPPDPPQIFLRSSEIDEFSIEWGEPKVYGDGKIKGYQVLLNDIKVGSELTAKQTKATIPCKPKKTYRVNVIALSNNQIYGNSPMSNTLIINSSGPHSENALDMTVSEDSGIPVKVVKVMETSIQLDWSSFVEKEDVAYYTIQWSSVAQPEQREVKLSKNDSNCVINKCLPGTTHFMRVVAHGPDSQILEKSKQLTIQTSAPPDAPKISLRACNFHYIAIQWNKPTTYGDALLTGYKVYVNGVVEAVLNADQLSYTYTQGKWCNEYAFQVQALTAGDTLNSKPSDPLIVTWPGSKPPEVKRLPSVSSSTIRVGWTEPYLTDGIKVKHYKLCCVETGTDKIVQTVGPIHPDSKEGELKNLKKGNYSVYLEIHLFGTDTVIKTEPFAMEPASSPDPPQISVTLVGLEERRQIEKFTCDLVNKRDRLIRQVGHKLKKIGALTYPMRAEKNEEVVKGAHSLTHIEELLESCFTALDNYTGHLTALVSWHCPQSNPEIHVSEYKLLVDGKQYGSTIPAGTKNIRIQLSLEQSNYIISMVACSDKPKGISDESNAVELLAFTFHPFSYYCYHGIHIKDTKYPNTGCCRFQDSINYERQMAKKLANQGLLQKYVPPPACSLLDIFEGDYRPLMSIHKPSCPTVLLFWTPWCLSSQKIMSNFARFSRENNSLMSYIAITCSMSGVSSENRKLLRQLIISNSWSDDRAVWHVTSECGSNIYRNQKKQNRQNLDSKTDQDRHKDKSLDLTEILGIAGVPTFLFIHPEGFIAWHGRYCAYDYSAFEAFMKHTMSEVLRQPCCVFHCDSCKGEITVDEVMSLQLPNAINTSHTHHLAARASSPSSTADRLSMSDMKYAAVNGYTNSISGRERVFVTENPHQRCHSPRHRCGKRGNISVNKRPYSATNNGDGSNMLDKSPYLACVAPHIHQPHKLATLRPASAKKLMHYV